MQLDKTENLWYNRSMEMGKVHKKKTADVSTWEGRKWQKIRGHIMYPYHIGQKGQKTAPRKKVKMGVDKGGRGVIRYSHGAGDEAPGKRPTA